MDEIVLTLPSDARWQCVAHLVLAGLAGRLDLTVETLEDWQLVFCELFGRRHGDGSLRIVFRASPELLEARFGPVESQLVEELEREDEGVGLRRVLSTLTDSVRVEETGGERWVVLNRAIVHPGGTH